MLKSKTWNIVLTVFGLVLIILSVVWLEVIFPSMNKLPADHNEVINTEGTYYVMNPTTQVLDEIPVIVTRNQTAQEVQGNVIIINQVITTTATNPGTELTQFGKDEMLGVDRSTREYVSGNWGDNVERSGQFAFPSSVEKKSYSVWMTSASRPLEAKFTGEEIFRGLKVYTFKVNEGNLDIGSNNFLYLTVELKVEPVSGTTVYSQARNMINTAVPMPVPGVTVTTRIKTYESDLVFTEETIDEFVDTANSGRTALLWCQVYGFWLGIGLGIILMLFGVLGLIRNRSRV